MRRVFLALLIGVVLNVPTAFGAVSDEFVQQLLQRLDAQEKRIAELEKAAQQTQTEVAEPKQAVAPVAAIPAMAPTPGPASWTDKLSLNGDLRMRYDNVDLEGAPEERNRQRLRARLGVIAKPQDDLELGLRLSTTENNSPRGGNQTLGDGNSSKDVVLDQAWFRWTALQGLSISGGKFQNMLYRPGQQQMLWDSDWNPEGFGLSYVNGPFFANAIGFWLESDSAKTEEFTYGGQLGTVLPITEDVKLVAGAGYYNFNTRGKGTFYGLPNVFWGNSSDPVTDTYLYNYVEIEGFAELAFRLAGLPASVFADYVRNTDADDNDTGWSAGVKLGEAKRKGSWQLSYAWQDLEADAVFAGLTDSDFAGGFSDNKGHRLQGAYALSDKWNVGLTYFINQTLVHTGPDLDFDRLQLDMSFRY